MEPKVGQIWKFQHGQHKIVEYHLLISYDEMFGRWKTYNIQTWQNDCDYEDQFQDNLYWSFVQ